MLPPTRLTNSYISNFSGNHPVCGAYGPATRNDFANDIVDDACADAIFATLKTIVDDGSSMISSTISLRVAGPLVLSYITPNSLVYDLLLPLA